MATLMRALMGLIKDRHGTYYAQQKVPERLQVAVARYLGNGKAKQVLRSNSYEVELTGIVKRFIHKPGSINNTPEDDHRFRQLVGTLPRLRYAPHLVHELEQGTVYHSPSLHCVQEFSICPM
jgi:hypothetical protein